jgi:replicative DNA helicase
VDLIVVDTGNLVQAENVRGKNFAQVESDKVRGIRNLIKELNCVGYVTWQLNKGVDSRPASGLGRMPTLGDLRDTGGVEEHASDVIGLYRDELYNPETIEYKNIMHLIGLKRRNDMGGTIQLIGYNPAYQRFFSPERREIPF